MRSSVLLKIIASPHKSHVICGTETRLQTRALPFKQNDFISLILSEIYKEILEILAENIKLII